MPRPIERTDRPVRVLRVLRLKAGLSQKRLANELNIFQVKLSHYEHGLDLTEEHGLLLLRFFQSTPQTAEIAKGLKFDDLTAFWPLETERDHDGAEAISDVAGSDQQVSVEYNPHQPGNEGAVHPIVAGDRSQ